MISRSSKLAEPLLTRVPLLAALANPATLAPVVRTLLGPADGSEMDVWCGERPLGPASIRADHLHPQTLDT